LTFGFIKEMTVNCTTPKTTQRRPIRRRDHLDHFHLFEEVGVWSHESISLGVILSEYSPSTCGESSRYQKAVL